MLEKDTHPEFVTALARGLDVIQAFSSSTPEMTLSEIAACTGLSPATVRRSLITLATLGYVRQHGRRFVLRSEEHTSELQSLMRISYAVFCLQNTKNHNKQ